MVRTELSAVGAPPVVREWIATPPPWLHVSAPPSINESLETLDAGEQAAIALAIHMKAELLLIDDRAGVRAALAHGLEAVGTLGILDQAASAGLIDLRSTLAQLTATSFRIRRELIDALLTKHGVGQ